MKHLLSLLIISSIVNGCIDCNGICLGIGDKKEISTNGIECTTINLTGISVFWIK